MRTRKSTTTPADGTSTAKRKTEKFARNSKRAAVIPQAVSPEQRYRMIAETAYFIAERRGFAAGSAVEDWLQAEAECDRRL